jgi:hypothetical protein
MYANGLWGPIKARERTPSPTAILIVRSRLPSFFVIKTSLEMSYLSDKLMLNRKQQRESDLAHVSLKI